MSYLTVISDIIKLVTKNGHLKCLYSVHFGENSLSKMNKRFSQNIGENMSRNTT